MPGKLVWQHDKPCLTTQYCLSVNTVKLVSVHDTFLSGNTVPCLNAQYASLADRARWQIPHLDWSHDWPSCLQEINIADIAAGQIGDCWTCPHHDLLAMKQDVPPFHWHADIAYFLISARLIAFPAGKKRYLSADW